jgi:hypothetical protein
MPVWLHMRLSILVPFAGAFVVPIIVCLIGVGMEGKRGVGFLISLPVASIVGLYLLSLLFRRVIPARCPQCGGSMHISKWRPITYTCTCCQQGHDTRINKPIG